MRAYPSSDDVQLDAALARIGLSHEPPDQEARMAINKYPHSILRIHAFVQKRKGPRRHGPQEEDRKAWIAESVRVPGNGNPIEEERTSPLTRSIEN